MTKLLCGSSFWRRWSHSRRAHSATAFWQRRRRLGGSRSVEKEKTDAEGEPEMDADGEGEGEAEEDGGSIAKGFTRPALPAVSPGQLTVSAIATLRLYACAPDRSDEANGADCARVEQRGKEDKSE